MLKIRSSQKKILKISIMTFLVMISSFLFNNQVSALDYYTVDGITFNEELMISKLEEFGYNKDDYQGYVMFYANLHAPSSHFVRMIYFKDIPIVKSIYSDSVVGIGREIYFTAEDISNAVIIQYNVWEDKWIERQPDSINTRISGQNYNNYSYTSKAATNWDVYYEDQLLIEKTLEFATTPTFNELNEVIDTNEIRSIQLDFIIPSNSLGTSLDFSYNISSSEKLFDGPYFTSSEIYCSTDETGASSCMPFAKSIDWYLDYNFATTQNDILKNYNTIIEKYSHYKVNDYIYNLFDESKSVESISMFISFDTVSGFDVNINFESNLKFNVIYNYKNTSDVVDGPFLEDYYSTIDLTGKYGVAFLPQTNLDDSLTGYRTLFQADNLADIQLRDNYDGKEYLILSAYSLNYCNEFLSNQNKIPYSCSNTNGIFDFYINQDMDRQTLFFINKNYDNNSKLNITYDTRYYSYIIFETENSTGSVVRPGEEEETEIYIGYFYNYYDKYKNYELEHSFDIFLKPINFIFDSISDFYNYYCPPVFKSFLIISFTFVVSLILIKLFL